MAGETFAVWPLMQCKFGPQVNSSPFKIVAYYFAFVITHLTVENPGFSTFFHHSEDNSQQNSPPVEGGLVGGTPTNRNALQHFYFLVFFNILCAANIIAPIRIM